MQKFQLKCHDKQNKNDQQIYFQQIAISSNQNHYDSSCSSLFKVQQNKCKDIVNLSQKRLIQSLKKIPIRKGSLFENSKIRKLELNFRSISNSQDLRNNKSDHIKMPDLLKIKLKKQLQTIQKKDKSNQSIFRSKHSQKAYNKSNKLSNILFDSNHHLEANSSSKDYEIVKDSLKNVKKSQGYRNKKTNHNNVPHIKDKQKQINLNEKRKVIKYFHLLDSASNDIKLKNFEKTGKHYVNRIKTQALQNSRLFNKGMSSLELQGTQIHQDSSLHDHKMKLAALYEQTIVAKEIQDAYLSRKRKQSQQRINRTKSRIVKSQGKIQSVKNHGIGPWINSFQQNDIGNNLVINLHYD